jgi:transcriptional regulator with XRE-family HTH domain
MISFAAGEAIFGRRDEHGVSLAELAAMTGIAEERLQALEEGESMTLHEVLLIHALRLSVSSDPGFHVVPGALVRATPHG